MNRSSETTVPHPDPALVAAYLDDCLPDSERSSLEAHLADCRECVDELVAVHRLKQQVASPSSRRSIRVGAVAVAAAAAVLAILVLRPGMEVDTRLSPGSSARQRADTPRPAPILLESPIEGAEVRRGDLSFSWTANGQDGGPYRLIVTGEEGDSLWAMETTGTSVVPPATLTLEVGRTFLWSVQRLDESGRPVSSGMHAFRLVP